MVWLNLELLSGSIFFPLVAKLLLFFLSWLSMLLKKISVPDETLALVFEIVRNTKLFLKVLSFKIDDNG